MLPILDRFSKWALSSRAFPGLCFALLLLLQNSNFGRYYPNLHGLLGHDFSLAHPAMLDGALWFWKNGLFEVPWFTPSFCAGQPFFADPQSGYYSPIQWLTFVLPPTTAAHLAMLLCTSIGYWSYYFLARSVFAASAAASVVCGALAMLNGFVPHRFVMGEIGYQLFLLTGFVAWMLLSKRDYLPIRRGAIGNIFWAGLAIALMVQGGLTSLMIPTALGVIGVGLIAALIGAGCSLSAFFVRGFGSVLFALAICAAKLVASAAFLSNFMRTTYRLPGFSSIGDAFSAVTLSMVASSQWMWEWSTPRLSNVQWTTLPHEWAYQFGFSFVVLLGVGIYFHARSRRRGVTEGKLLSSHGLLAKGSLTLALILLLLVPVGVLYYEPAWNDLLKKIPTLSTTSFPFRWIIVWIPVGCVAGLMAWRALEKALPARDGVALLLVFLTALALEQVIVDQSYYQSPMSQNFSGEELDVAWIEGKDGNLPGISHLVDGPYVVGPSGRNKAIIWGASYLRCYNPVYGYGNELFPVGRLRYGESVLHEVQPGHLNLKNPACLIWPIENKCEAVGSEFLAAQRDEVKRFVSREPFAFEFSGVQKAANLVTGVALWLVGFGFLIALGQWLARTRIGHGR